MLFFAGILGAATPVDNATEFLDSQTGRQTEYRCDTFGADIATYSRTCDWRDFQVVFERSEVDETEFPQASATVFPKGTFFGVGDDEEFTIIFSDAGKGNLTDAKAHRPQSTRNVPIKYEVMEDLSFLSSSAKSKHEKLSRYEPTVLVITDDEKGKASYGWKFDSEKLTLVWLEGPEIELTPTQNTRRSGSRLQTEWLKLPESSEFPCGVFLGTGVNHGRTLTIGKEGGFSVDGADKSGEGSYKADSGGVTLTLGASTPTDTAAQATFGWSFDSNKLMFTQIGVGDFARYGLDKGVWTDSRTTFVGRWKSSDGKDEFELSNDGSFKVPPPSLSLGGSSGGWMNMQSNVQFKSIG